MNWRRPRRAPEADRLPQTGERGLALRRRLHDKLIEHEHCIRAHGQGLPEIRNRQWNAAH